MSQISPPLRILLAGSVLFLAAWFVLLRPGGGEEAVPAAPVAGQPASAPGQAVQGAEQAAEAASSGQPAAGTAPSTGAAPATGTSPAPEPAETFAVNGRAALAKAGMPRDVARQVDKRIVVLAFVNRDAADDRRVAGSMRKVYRHGDKVWTKTASINDVSKYGAITRGADVQQSPTVLVVDKHRDVASLVGFVDSVSINQAVVDALLVDGRAVDRSPYLQKLEGICGDLNRDFRNLRDPRSLKEFKAYVAALSGVMDKWDARMRGTKAPRRYRSLRRQLVSLSDAGKRLMAKVEGWVRTGQVTVSAVDADIRSIEKKSRNLDLRLAGLGMEDCR